MYLMHSTEKKIMTAKKQQTGHPQVFASAALSLAPVAVDLVSASPRSASAFALRFVPCIASLHSRQQQRPLFFGYLLEQLHELAMLPPAHRQGVCTHNTKKQIKRNYRRTSLARHWRPGNRNMLETRSDIKCSNTSLRSSAASAFAASAAA